MPINDSTFLLLATRAAGTAALATLLAFPTAADVTLLQTTTGTGVAKAGGDRTRTYLEESRMRADVLDGEKIVSSTILDLEARTMTVLDHGKERATIHDLSELAAAQRQIGETDVKVSVEATPETGEVLGATCRVHDMRIEVDGGSSMPMPVKVVVAGPVCLVADAPGREEMAAFYRTMAERGLFLGAPEQAQAQPGQARGFALLYEEMAEKGVGYRSELTVDFEGEGFMAAMLSKLGFTTTSELVAISTDEIPDEVFQVPAGWKTTKQ